MNIQDMQQALDRDEIRVRVEEVDGEQFSIVSYMVATPDLWEVPNAIEARGITFDSQGNCVCRTMEKFFNINENQYTQLSDLDFNGAIAYEKLDGSMITVVQIGDRLVCKTKKSFYSDVAINAQRFFDSNENLQQFSKHLIDNGFTPTFEFESPDSQIVVEQYVDQMTFLCARHIKTGKYMDFDAASAIASYYSVNVVSWQNCHNIHEFIEHAKVVEGIEGWVFLLQSGQRVKLKTAWYLARHRLTSYTERNVFDLILNEEIDDLMPLFEKKADALEKVNAIGHRIAHLMKEVESQSEELVNQWKSQELTLPVIGKTYSSDPLFSLAIRLYKGQEPDFKNYVSRFYRDSFESRPLFWGFDVDA